MKQVLKGNKKKVYIAVILLASFLGTYGIGYVCGLIVGTQFSNGIISAAAVAVNYVMLKQAWEMLKLLDDKKTKKKRLIYSFGLSMFFCVLLIWGYQLKANGYTDPGFKGKGLTLLRAMCLSLVVWPFSNYFFGWLEKISIAKEEKVNEKPWKSKYVFLLSWFIIFACWIPVFLAYYPAIMTYDFHRQSIEAVRGFIWFNSYQPLAHTWLIWLFFNIGQALGGYQTGMALYSIFQMLVFSVACAYSCSVIYRLVKSKLLVSITILFFGVFPFISVLALSVTKDILFSALFLIFICLFLERSYFSCGKKQIIIDMLWILEGIIMMLYRNNAIYAVAVFAVIYLFVGVKKQKFRIFVICIILVVGGKLGLEGVQAWIGTEIRGSKIEMFSVPLQQFCRVGLYHQDELDDEYYRAIDTYVPNDYWDEYNPPLSDTIKIGIAQDVFPYTWEGHYSEMFRDWFKVGLKYPNTYIDAFLELTAGYWFFDDVTWAEVLGYGVETRMGALYTYNATISEEIPEGIEQDSKIPFLERWLEEIVSGNCFFKWPLISNLFKPALYSWALLLLVISAVYLKERKKASIMMLPLIYLGTMFLGPVVNVRYILPIMVIIPMMFAMLLSHKEFEMCE